MARPRMPGMTVPELKKDLSDARGNVSAVARKHGVDWSTINKRVQESPVLQQVLRDARESMLDNAESKLYSKALEGDTTCLTFFLRTQGRHRGYVDRTELVGDPDGTQPIVIKWGGNETDSD